MSISSDVLKKEQALLKDSLRAIEGEQRQVEATLREVRQRELRAKRELEALQTLIDLSEARETEAKESAAGPTSAGEKADPDKTAPKPAKKPDAPKSSAKKPPTAKASASARKAKS